MSFFGVLTAQLEHRGLGAMLIAMWPLGLAALGVAAGLVGAVLARAGARWGRLLAGVGVGWALVAAPLVVLVGRG